MLTPEQEKEVKEQLIEQIDSSFPESKKSQALKQVESMSSEELESFVNKSSSGCIFCSIASGNSKSYKVAENDSAVAVLEINPISRGHVIVIPKEHASFKNASGLMDFAKQVALILREKLSPKDVEISSVDFQGHGVVNLIPVYTNENIKSERHPAKREELEEVSSILQKPTEVKKEKPKRKVSKPRVKKLDSRKLWLPKRIP